jgi:hypothetical protein
MKKKEVILNLKGGLGNQLFQLAALRYVTDKNNLTPIINLSQVSNKKSFQRFVFETDILKSLFPNKLFLTNKNDFFCIYKILGKMKRFIPKAFFVQTYLAASVGYDVALEQPIKHKFMEGYFQTYRYAESLNLKKSLTYFRPDNSFYLATQKEIKSINPIIIHIRGGDYLIDTSGIGNLSHKYFSRCIEVFGKQKMEIWVVTNDLIHAASIMSKIAIPYKVLDPENKLTAFETILLISSAKKIIISNSTFAWWGAYLSHDSKICCPLNWYKELDDPIDMIPETWQKIESYWDD